MCMAPNERYFRVCEKKPASALVMDVACVCLINNIYNPDRSSSLADKHN